MSNYRVEKILVGSPTYKVVVGDYTKVKRVVVGTPTRNVFIATDADFNELRGIDVTPRFDGDVLVYNDSSGLWEATNTLNKQVIDGRFYNQDSERAQILTRRSRDEGIPSYLRDGELAYSQLANAGTDGIGNGGERLYMGVGVETVIDGIIRAPSIHIIGGKYFTDLLNHQHGILTPSSAVIVDSAKRINEWFTDDLIVYNNTTLVNMQADSASIGNLSVTNLTAVNINIDNLFSNIEDIFREGEAIDITRDSVANTITFSAEIANDSDNLGVVKFDLYADSDQTQKQFAVSDSGSVSILYINGGTF